MTSVDPELRWSLKPRLCLIRLCITPQQSALLYSEPNRVLNRCYAECQHGGGFWGGVYAVDRDRVLSEALTSHNHRNIVSSTVKLTREGES